MSIASEIALQLLQIKAIKLSPQTAFTWASGLRSPIYCDNRLVLSNPEARDFVVRMMQEKARSMRPFEAIAGVATAGIPHGVLLADRMRLPFVYVRDKAKGHGRQNVIEGELKPGASVLVVEDLISTGGSSLKAVEALREAGASVMGVLAIFSYGFADAQAAFETAQCPLDTLSHYDALLAEAVRMEYISPQEHTLLAAWRMDPNAWSEQFLANHA
ncbi:MAG: orotate phosphoribosyltransferase [Haliscomenobacter sp.]|nr:orotate phosphoribosyltransferase [Haliscomenobacter sp.]MBK7476897.1 orotate phosphoribosyltransferase [Haliscomenobacter sp.]MBK8879961.1 orotate phosphoribosyltransferase [Haliscomenobacter sp.]